MEKDLEILREYIESRSPSDASVFLTLEKMGSSYKLDFRLACQSLPLSWSKEGEDPEVLLNELRQFFMASVQEWWGRRFQK